MYVMEADKNRGVLSSVKQTNSPLSLPYHRRSKGLLLLMVDERVELLHLVAPLLPPVSIHFEEILSWSTLPLRHRLHPS